MFQLFIWKNVRQRERKREEREREEREIEIEESRREALRIRERWNEGNEREGECRDEHLFLFSRSFIFNTSTQKKYKFTPNNICITHGER